MGNRLASGYVSLVLVASLELGTAPWAEAQPRTQSSKWTERELLGCSLRRFSGCLDLAVSFWNSFADSALASVSATTPTASSASSAASAAPQDPILRDAGYYHPNAPALYALENLVTMDLGRPPTGCGQLLSNREKLARMMCAASLQLSSYRGNEWRGERKRLSDLRDKLVGAGCLPATPADPCALDTLATVVSPVSVESEAPRDLEAQGFFELAADPAQGLVERSLALVHLE